MTRRAAAGVMGLLAWFAGSTIAPTAELPAASARTPGIVFGRAHGGDNCIRPAGAQITILRSDRTPGRARTRSPRARTRST